MCSQLADALKSNRTIYGFHFTGNYGYVDARGFLVVVEEVNQNFEPLRMHGIKQIQFHGLNTK
jgi:NLR family CARD domain-containing protein 3